MYFLGLAAGAMFCLAGTGVIVLHWSNRKDHSETNRFLLILCGFLLIVVGYNLLTLFLRIKFPGYLQ